MSFAQKYIDLLEKYEIKVEAIKALSVTEAFGVPIIQSDSSKQLAYDLNYARDYQDRDYGYVEKDNEEFYATDLGYACFECDWENNLNTAFEEYVKSRIQEQGITHELLQKLVQDETNLNLLLGGFYLDITDNLYLESSREYIVLRQEYPNEKYYPKLHVNADDITYFESSKCW